MDYLLPRVGPFTTADGVYTSPRLARSGELATIDAHARYQESVIRGNVYSMTLITTTGVPAGQIVAAGAAAVTQFAVFNPVASTVNLVLLRFRQGVISGTAGAGAVMHGAFSSIPTLAASGSAVNMKIGATNGSQAKLYSSAAGAALTGGTAPTTLFPSTISYTNTAQATVGPSVQDDELAGGIIIPPGMGWLPLQPAAGTTFLVAYGVTWEEVPL